MKLILVFLILTGFGYHLSAQTCPSPLIFTSSEISDTSVVLRWFTLNEPDSGYQIDVQLKGLPPSSPTFRSKSTDRDTISGLSPQSSYTAYIRSVCTSDTSAWKQIDFFTALRNGTTCGMSLELRDNNCQNGPQRIPIFVKGYQGELLGIHRKLSDLELILSHSYPADLKLTLINPGGTEIVLTEFHGTQTDHFGDPTDSVCMQHTVFSTHACTSIYDHDPPFIGEYQSEEPLGILNDGSPVNGRWILEVCDRAADDVGELNYLQLNFSQDTCPAPPELSPVALSDTGQLLSFTSLNADSMLVLYSQDSVAPDSVQDPSFLKKYAHPNDSLLRLNGLQLNEDYYYWTYIYCDNQWLGPSCTSIFTTVPGIITHYSDWESESICPQECDTSCSIEDTIWNSFGPAWQRTSGMTPTPATGPDADVFFDGIYIYKEASAEGCREVSSILQSICLSKINSSVHGISFFVQLNGANAGGLVLRVSQDEWLTSDTLWMIKGNQGPQWLRKDLFFPDSLASPFQVQFIASGAEGAFGDIAIGDIALIGVETVPLFDQLAFPDKDMDGYGNGEIAVFYCGAQLPELLAKNGNDCNDENAAFHPMALDSICNGRDENCDGQDNFGGASEMQLYIDSIRSPSCPQSQNGLINVSIEGGITPYRIQWSNGDTSALIDNLKSGTYSITVTDKEQCQTITRSIPLNAVQEMQFAFQIIQEPSCPIPTNGSLSVHLNGGTPPYQILWSNGEMGDTAYAVPPGEVYVAVEDAAGCQFLSDTLVLKTRKSFEAEIITIDEVSCPGNADASLRAIAPGGSPPLQYEWNTGDTTALIDNLPPGMYTVTITDNQNCMVVADSVIVAHPEPISLTQLTIDPQQCSGVADGHISAQVNGGSPPYSLRWLTPKGNVKIGAELNQLLPGYYHLTITDREACVYEQDSIFVAEQQPIVLDHLFIKDTKCPLSRDGQIQIDLGGGAPPYDLVWSDGKQMLEQRDGLMAGTYGLTVSDALNCKQTFNNLRIEKGDSSLRMEINIIDPLLCSTKDEALIEAQLTDGDPPYRYNWSAGVEHQKSQATDTLIIARSGIYQLTVTDGIGCVGISDTVSVDSLANISIDSLYLSHPNCYRAMNGRITVQASSPRPPIDYYWSNEGHSASIDSLSAGLYQLTISDASDCQPRIFEFELEQPDAINVNIDTLQMEDSLCFSITSITGGSPPYVFKWWLNEQEIQEEKICIHQSNISAIQLEVSDSVLCNRRILVYEGASSIESEFIKHISVYPNPTSHQLLIENTSNKLLSVSLTNLNGTLIGEYNIKQGRTAIAVHEIPSGIYFLNIKTSKSYLGSFKIVVH